MNGAELRRLLDELPDLAVVHLCVNDFPYAQIDKVLFEPPSGPSQRGVILLTLDSKTDLARHLKRVGAE